MHRVLDQRLALLHLGLGVGADADLGDAAGQLGEPLLQLLLVVVRRGGVDLAADLLGARLDVGGLALALDDRAVVTVDQHLLGDAELAQLHLLEVEAEVLEDRLAAAQDRDVLQHGLAAVAVARRLDRADLQHAAQLVDHQRRERLALDVLGDDQQRLVALLELLEQRQHRPDVRQLVLVHQHVAVAQVDRHVLVVGDEVRRQVAAVELHALDDLDLGLQALALLDRDHAVLADLLHRVGQDLADLGVVVAGDRGDLGDGLVVVAGHRLGHLLQLVDDGGAGGLDALDQLGVVGAGGQVAHALFGDRVGEQRRRRGAVTGRVRRLAGRFAHELRAHVLVAVFELDLLGDGDAVLGDRGTAPTLVEHGIAAARTQGGDNGLRQLGDPEQHCLPGVVFEYELFDHHNLGEESGYFVGGGSSHLVEMVRR